MAKANGRNYLNWGGGGNERKKIYNKASQYFLAN